MVLRQERDGSGNAAVSSPSGESGGLPAYTGKLLVEKPQGWRHGVITSRQHKLEPLLQALKVLVDAGLTAAGVIAQFHLRRVLPLMKRERKLFEMGSTVPHEETSEEKAWRTVAVQRTRRAVHALPVGLFGVVMLPGSLPSVSVVSYALVFVCLLLVC